MRHALLSPSAAHRWLACPGSVAASRGASDRPSDDADRGTACHALLAAHLRGRLSPNELAREVGKTADVSEPGEPLRSVEVTAEMTAWVRQAAAWVHKRRLAGRGFFLRVEAKVPVGKFYGCPDDLWGHADAILYQRRGTLVVADAKFGAQEVEVEKNPQLSLYAVGAAEELLDWWGHDDLENRRVELVVLQPRSPQPVKVELLTGEELLERARNYQAAVALALEPDGELVPGGHCTYCPVAGTCPALQARAGQLARREFADPRQITVEQLAEVLRLAPLARRALEAAEAHAMRLLESGAAVPGWKRVAGQGRRKWTDEAAAAKVMAALGLEPYEKVLLSPNKAEVALGVGRSNLLTPLAPKVPGNPVLAPEDDPRPALPPAFEKEKS